ncbi:histidine phosphatase superfamily [Lipomyces kononenkoae]
MTGRVHLVRHAESVHNTDHDFSRPDPELTALGRQQSAELGRVFPYSDRISVIVASPLRRTIETALAGFANVLDKRYFDESSGLGVSGGAELALDPGLQERSDLPCDTGSDEQVLKSLFSNLDFSGLPAGWQRKEELYSPDAVDERANRVRRYLAERMEQNNSEREDIVVVTHGAFMKHLSGDPDVDLPKAGWRSYTIERGEDGNFVLVATEGLV